MTSRNSPIFVAVIGHTVVLVQVSTLRCAATALQRRVSDHACEVKNNPPPSVICCLLATARRASFPEKFLSRRWSPGVDWLVSVDRLAKLLPWSDSEVARHG